MADVTTIVGGGTPASKDDTNFAKPPAGIPWITPADLSHFKDQYIRHGARNLSQKGFEVSSAKKMPAGTVLFSSRAPIGYVVIAMNQVTTSQGFKSFVLPAEICSKYVYQYLRHIKPLANQMATGTTFKELSGSSAALLPLLLPPLPEQTRIANKLDTLLGRVDRARERLDRVPEMLKRFRQAVLTAATSGVLTEGWRELSPNSWASSSLSSICIKVTDGEHISPQITTVGIPLVSAKDVREWGVDFSDTKFVHDSFSIISRKRCDPSKGDVLVVSRGATIGRTCLVTCDQVFCLMGSVLLFRPNQDFVTPEFFALVLKSPSGLSQLTAASGASAQSAIYIRDAKQLNVLLPTIPEQTEIVRQVEILFAYADRLESRLKAARKLSDNLSPAILAKAFRGELVAQDPNDEPAVELLKRIRAGRK